MSSSLVPEEINRFLADVHRNRNGTSRYRTSDTTVPFVAPPGQYYASEILLSETGSRGRGAGVRRPTSKGSSATEWTTVFDDTDGYSVYSASTAPLPYGPEPLHLRRPPVTDTIPSWLPCEFRRLSGCQENFGLDETDEWIEHITSDHLAGECPMYSICWFCDDARFASASAHAVDKVKAFRARMYHVANHFRNGMVAADIRPDFWYLDHLHLRGLIDERAFQLAAQQSESVPQPRDVIFADQPVRTRARSEVYNETRSRHGHQRETYRRPRMQGISE
ncbi:hypothetical protein DCS_05439 [Drechmeria coniospora]|uniref:Uncharacterized protein n=1 Tax=Drechmeria coniospora TaxID=98403 RepID=A0A151GMS3_DRECN|nr:hypothetical protein DCS_05439 [Drechmeria coniospora]KYK58424.1 hypothetical protein DCS_05439 [Drechmeria coniospora]ODA83927.1 hypothetical protein RJ55_02444 [Drechmeria coniospora]